MELSSQRVDGDGWATCNEPDMAVRWSNWTDGWGSVHEVAHLVTPDGWDRMQFDFTKMGWRIWSLWDSTTDKVKPRIEPFVPLVLGFYWRRKVASEGPK